MRGPVKGINKILPVIKQIDSPVGQVCDGIDTVQVNSEHRERMDFFSDEIKMSSRNPLAEPLC